MADVTEASKMVQELAEHTSINQLGKLAGVSNLTLSKIAKGESNRVSNAVFDKIIALYSDVQAGNVKLDQPKRGRSTGTGTRAPRKSKSTKDLTIDQQLQQIEQQMQMFESLEKKKKYLLEAQKLQEKHKQEMEQLKEKYADVL